MTAFGRFLPLENRRPGASERPVSVRADIGLGRVSAFHSKAVIELELV